MIVPSRDRSFLDTLSARVAESSRAAAERAADLRTVSSSAAGKWSARIYALNVEVEALEKTLRAVQSELKEAQCGLERARNAALPIRRLPDTILASIFCAGLQSCRTLQEEHAFVGLVSSISYHWRTVAIASPPLWSSIFIGLGRFNSQTRLYLERSSGALLRLTINANNESTRWSPVRLQKWIESLSPYLARCQTLDLRTTDHSVVQSILPIQIPMPNLLEFSWDASSPEESEDSHPNRPPLLLLDSEVSSPHSYLLTIRHVAYQIQWPDRILANLKHLTVAGRAALPLRNTVDLVTRCPSLLSLRSLHFADETIAFPSDMPTFTSSTLRTLQMDLPDQGTELGSVTWNMEFPLLEHLVVSAWPSNTRWAESSLGCTERFPSLRSAWISTHAFSAAAIMDFICAHPNLLEFGCVLSSSVAGILSVLTEPLCVAPWSLRLPRLRYLEFIRASQSLSAAPEVVEALRALLSARGLDANGQAILTVHINDESFHLEQEIPCDYSELAEEFPRNVFLTHNEDLVPTRFRPELV